MNDRPTSPNSTSAAEAPGAASDQGDPDAECDSGDCRDAVRELYGFLDGELTTDKRAAIGEHLDACGDCLDAFEFHTELRAVVSEKCRTALPPGLRDRVFDALRALEG